MDFFSSYNRLMSRIEEIAEQVAKHKTPPVHLWAPHHVGEIDIYIDAEGRWFHEGGVIKRDALVSLFASILWAEEGDHYLVTPAEKLKIQVEDVPFVVRQAEWVEGSWVTVTNVNEQIIVSQDNPIELREYNAQWLPYLNVRYDLWARVSRSVYYQWVTEALDGSHSEGDSLRLGGDGYIFEVARM